MLRFWEKRSYRRFLYSKAALFVYLVITAMLVRAAVAMYLTQRSAAAVAEEERHILGELEGREETLAAEVAWLETERGAEEEIRTKFRVAKEGEELIVLVDPPAVDDAAVPPPKKSFMKKILDFFSGTHQNE